jgi:nitroimidazol reductase NimA-like FMN-containing flavoprotein (pyridoxamine 5'-phosphate oxidase superfamily)
MRRSDFDSKDELRLKALLDKTPIGSLGLLSTEGWPLVIPLNFVWFDESICFHGADDGEKFKLMQMGENAPATFSVYREFSLLPSYWIARDYACPATTLFRSALFKGHAQIIQDIEKKAAMLEAFMQKFQPEGNYRTITTGDVLYKKALEETIAFRIDAKDWSFKEKFLQHKPLDFRKRIVEKLRERGHPVDLATANEIELFY